MKEIYRGKAKTLYEGEDGTCVMVFRDELTAGDGAKRAEKAGKGSINAEISAVFMQLLEKNGIRTHFISFEPPDRHVVKRLRILPVEVIVRNIATGSLVRRYPFKEGTRLEPPVVEFCLKSDEYHDPMVNEDIALALGLVDTPEELQEMRRISLEVNRVLSDFLREKGILLVDFKLEFGYDDEGNLLVGDEISPDTCRFWDADTGEVMDKDRFRRDMGSVIEYYREVKRRVCG